MKKIGIFYGSSTGYTANLANEIAETLGVDMADVHDVASTAPSAVGDYEVLLLGTSTWGAGDMQSDFEDFVDGVQAMSLRGKKIGLFGCGDETMAMTFGGALGEAYKMLQGTGAEFIGEFNTDGYSYDTCGACVDGKCVGLLIDDVNHPELSAARIASWAKEVKDQM